MVKETKAYKCEECGKTFISEHAAEECTHGKKGKVYGDPIAICE